MAVYIHPGLRNAINSESGIYSGFSTKLLESYVQTSRDLLTIDNDTVRTEVLDVLNEKLYHFRAHVPRSVRKRKNVSELIREVEGLIHE